MSVRWFKYAVCTTFRTGVSRMNMNEAVHRPTGAAGNAFEVKAVGGSTRTFTTPGSDASFGNYQSSTHAVLVVA